ncbi:transcriptional regulator [Clostridium sp. SY8519]|uniref:LysR family transcriptional regulator n=1 Tax=Clostridium sp. (strain SY8519) TaxID=1042156 RepID=UPI0002171B3B|nr:LysR family transcriptional regulator [Clostridium sp. SY8519]BAK47004.1 transcriptional regulator [Clostridium sp. SY8519]
MNDNQIICFLEAAKEKNFSRAAENLYQTQPGISRTIASLERELDTRLFIRTPGKPLELTESGRIYFEAFSNCQREFQTARQKSDQLKRRSSRTLRFGYASGWSISRFLPAMLRVLEQEYPYINIEVECHPFDHLFQLVLQNDLDLVLTIDTRLFNSPQLERKPIYQLPKVILYPKYFPRPSSPLQFQDETFFLYDDKTSPDINDEIFRVFQRYHFSPKIKRVKNQATMISMVENGQGVAVMDLWSQPVYMDQFDFFPLPDTHSIVLAYRKECENNPAMLSLRKTLAKELPALISSC